MVARAERSSFVIILIGLFKLFKALMLIVIGIGALHYLHRDLATSVNHWVEVLRVDPENRYIHRVLMRIFRVTPKQLKELSIGTFLYAGLFLTEGIGLLLRKRWAQYFTIITTSTLIPLEVYEIFQHFTFLRLAVMIVNVLIVIYLVMRVRSR